MGKIIKNKIEYTGGGISQEELDKKAERSIYADDHINMVNNGEYATDWHVAIGYNAISSHGYNVAIGDCSSATSSSSFALGHSAIASGMYAHSLGTETNATERYSTAIGHKTTASGQESYAEGYKTIASGGISHAEGNETQAIGYLSHTKGYKTIAKGSMSYAEGCGTISSGASQHVQGKFNIEDTDNKYADIVGNGKSATAPSNAYTLDWNGNAWFAGEVTNASGKMLSTNDFTNELKEKLENLDGSGGTSSSTTIDSELSTTSTNPVQNKIITQKINEMEETIQSLSIEVDSELSTTSTNPVQNKIITKKLNEVFQSVSNGKSLIASAITDKGVYTQNDATFETMANNISKISGDGCYIEDYITIEDWILLYINSITTDNVYAWYNKSTKRYRFFYTESVPVLYCDVGKIERGKIYGNFLFGCIGTIKTGSATDWFLPQSTSNSYSYITNIFDNDDYTFCYVDMKESEGAEIHPSWEKHNTKLWDHHTTEVTFKEMYSLELNEDEDNLIIVLQGSTYYIYVYKQGYYHYIDTVNGLIIYGDENNAETYRRTSLTIGEERKHTSKEELLPTTQSYTHNTSVYNDWKDNWETYVLFNTKDLCDENGNVLLPANCSIEDFI